MANPVNQLRSSFFTAWLSNREHVPVSSTAVEIDGVCAVMVTYGSREELLGQALNAVERCGVRRIVIVANGVDDTYLQMIQRLTEREYPQCYLVHLLQNAGSAEGFRCGVEAALKIPEVQFLWFVDDDNTTDRCALSALLATYRKLVDEHATDRLALLSLRTARPVFVRIADGATPESLFPSPDAVAGFDVARAVRRHVGRLCRSLRKGTEERQPTVGSKGIIEVPYGPYSGLFLHRDLIGRIGLPDPHFVLYGDDEDFTSRIAATGGKLFLVPESVIDDIEGSWHVAGGHRFDSLLYGTPDFRVFYSVRNGAYVSRRGKNAGLRFMVNRSAFMACLLLLALWHGKLDRYRLVRLALRDGLEGRLGKKPGFNLPGEKA